MNENTLLLQYFGQFRYKPTNRLSITAGMHAMNFTLNNSFILEPRVAIQYQVGSQSNMYISYGLHGQQQPIPVYFYQEIRQDGTFNRLNKELDFTKAHHFVLGYENRFARDWRLKTEAYHQRIFDVPVEPFASGFSLLNAGNTFTFPEKGGLVNKGTGENTGVELTVEKFLSKGYYMMATASLFSSTYKGSDGVRRNTTFDFGNVVNVLAGREWAVGKSKQNFFTSDIRLTSIGGRYVTPVDVHASIAAGKEMPDESRYNDMQLDRYFRMDAKAGLRINCKKRNVSHSLYLDFQNITNHQNIFLQRFNALNGTIGNVYQIGFFPDFLYRVNF